MAGNGATPGVGNIGARGSGVFTSGRPGRPGVRNLKCWNHIKAPDTRSHWGEAGTDTLIGGDHTDHMRGGDGNDWLDGKGAVDYLFGGRDRDTLYGGSGDDVLSGGYGADHLYGQDGDDTLVGGPPGDNDLRFVYGRGNIGDMVYGESGNDILYGTGWSTLWGGDDDDLFYLYKAFVEYRVRDEFITYSHTDSTDAVVMDLLLGSIYRDNAPQYYIGEPYADLYRWIGPFHV